MIEIEIASPKNSEKKSEFQMGFEPTTLRDLARCSNHWATADSMVSKGEMWVFDWNRIMQLHSQMMTRPQTIESTVTQWLEHPARSRRVVGSNPIWNSDFFSEFSGDAISISIIYLILTL